ncbi:hexose transporter Hxt15p [Trichomonascus vanleenenianus]|uniref:hexose transporter Hxt15p n=1 Tax=Trichomonascus vanleenenianus TaxID=2268995 RepID=UPI003EC98289
MSNLEHLVVEQRLKLAGKSGIKGLFQNKVSFLNAMFASLGGMVYGYNQGMFGQVLSMQSFSERIGEDQISNPVTRGLLTSILELGAWVGVLGAGYFSDKLGRKGVLQLACVIFMIGIIVQATVHGGNPDYIYAGRFIAGMGVGIISQSNPLYNAEISPPEIRGSLVSFYQFSIAFGIFISYWITYGTNFIGGEGANQSDAAWLIPITIQIAPALILLIGINWIPSSPRWLMHVGREEECLQTISKLRRLPADNHLVRMEFLEIKVQHLFAQRVSARDYPDLQDGSFKSNFKLGIAQYKSFLTNKGYFKRVSVGCLIMVFQQWSGINFILYYAPFIFESLHLGGKSTSLLSGGVVGIVQVCTTVLAVLFMDQFGRKNSLITGAIGMGVCMFIVAGIIAQFENGWTPASGWTAAFFIWFYNFFFSYSWGPGAWTVVAEIFPLSLRSKGMSIAASSNWLNNFAVALSTPDFVARASYGAYIFLGIMSILGGAYVYFFVPETKGRTLEEIDELFGDNSGSAAEDVKLQEEIAREVGLFALAGIEGEFADEKEVDADHNEKV